MSSSCSQVSGKNLAGDGAESLLALIPQCLALETVSIDSGASLASACLPLLAALPALQRLTLQRCGVLDGRGLDALTRLRSLSLSGVLHTDSVLRSASSLSGLTALEVSWGRGLTVNGLARLRALTALSTLKMTKCFIYADGLEQLLRLTALRELDLSASLGELLLDVSVLQQLTRLTRLGLQHAVLRPLRHGTLDAAAPSIVLPSLRALNIGMVRDGHGSYGFLRLFGGHPDGLREAAVSWCEVSSDRCVYRAFRDANLSSLRKLTLYGWSPPAGQFGLDRFPQLADDLVDFPALEHLVLSGFEYATDEGIACLAVLPALHRLVLWRCGCVTPAVLQRFAPRALPLTVSFAETDAAL